jgi:membrane-bound lytic murein transglycosylase B
VKTDIKLRSRLLIHVIHAMMITTFILPFSLPACAQESGLNFRSLEIRLINDQSEKFQPDQIKTLFENSGIEFEVKTVGSYFLHQEAKLNYDQFLSDESIEKARQYQEQYKADLEKAEKEYGVDKNVITAIMLVETRLGKNVGSSSVMNVLATMAALEDPDIRELFWKQLPENNRISKEEYDVKAPKKAQWAYNELKAFIKYAEREGLDPASIDGSYAGAMGIAQFMPTNALTLAKDGNQDGSVNLFQHEDAIASIANYLKRYGWKPGLTQEQAYDVVYHYNHSKYYVNTILKIRDKLKG